MTKTSTRFASALIAAVALFNVAAHAATFTESSPEAFAAANAAAAAPTQHCDAIFTPGPQSTDVIAAYPAGHVFESQCLISGAPAPVAERPATFRAEGSNVDVVLPPYFHFEPSSQDGEVIGYPVTFRATGSDVVQILTPGFHFYPSSKAG